MGMFMLRTIIKFIQLNVTYVTVAHPKNRNFNSDKILIISDTDSGAR